MMKIRRALAGALLALTMLTAQAGIATAEPPTASPNCCASAWYPHGWYFSEIGCNNAGEAYVNSEPLALAHNCFYVSNPPASAGGRHYHLYILEAT